MKKLFLTLSIPFFLIAQTASPSYAGPGDCEVRDDLSSTGYTIIEDGDSKRIQKDRQEYEAYCNDGDIEFIPLLSES